MSIINSGTESLPVIRHTVVNYVSSGAGITKALAGQRLVTACYRNNTTSALSRTNRAVSIPKLSNEEISIKMPVLLPLVVEYLETVQDKIFKQLLDANGVCGVVNEIADSSIGLDAVIEFLSDSSGGERLTKESICNWYSSNLEGQLMVALASKLGISETCTDAESKRIELISNEYKAKFAAMAGGKTSYNEKLATSLKNALTFASPDDSLAIKFNVKLDKMIADSQVKIDLFDLL